MSITRPGQTKDETGEYDIRQANATRPSVGTSANAELEALSAAAHTIAPLLLHDIRMTVHGNVVPVGRDRAIVIRALVADLETRAIRPGRGALNRPLRGWIQISDGFKVFV